MCADQTPHLVPKVQAWHPGARYPPLSPLFSCPLPPSYSILTSLSPLPPPPTLPPPLSPSFSLSLSHPPLSLSLLNQHSSPGEKNRAGFLPLPGRAPEPDWAIVCFGLKVIATPTPPLPKSERLLEKRHLGGAGREGAERGRDCIGFPLGSHPWLMESEGPRGPQDPLGFVGRGWVVGVGEKGSSYEARGAEEAPSQPPV